MSPSPMSVVATLLLAVCCLGAVQACSSPEVTSTSFTTQDATIVARIAYVSEFSVKCASGSVGNLYAVLDGAIVPVPQVTGNNYQVSWTENIKGARSGEIRVPLYDEEGYNAVRKAVRGGAEIESVPALFEVAVRHPGAFTGPWLKSEFLATIVSLTVAYIAISARSKLVA